MTLEKLAQSTALTISFLSQVERDAVSPSVESLQKLATALRTKVGAFFEEDERKAVTLIRKAQRLRRIDEKTRSTIETLASGILDIRMEPRLFTLDVGGEGQELGPHASEAFGLVLEGKVEVVRGKEGRLSMEKGDSVSVRNPQTWKIVNTASEKAEVLWITFMAEV